LEKPSSKSLSTVQEGGYSQRPQGDAQDPRSKIQPTDIYRHKLQLTEALFVNGTFPLTMFLSFEKDSLRVATWNRRTK
jgi:hypothetical protein